MSRIEQRPGGQSLPEWIEGLPELFTSDRRITRDVSEARRRGLLRKVGPRLYTRDLETPLETLTGRNAVWIASLLVPGAVLSHRSALEQRPARGRLFLTQSYERTIRLAGLTLRLTIGPGPLAGDMPMLDLYCASPARAFLENLRPTKARGVSRVLVRSEIETRLERVLQQKGERGLNALRDQARELAEPLGAERAFTELDRIVGALLETRAAALTSPVARARAAGGRAYDDRRLHLFHLLRDELAEQWADRGRPVAGFLRHELQNLAFCDAYFSNFIEGTRFELEEAEGIIFRDETPRGRPQDAHDIRGTYELLVDETEMGVSATTFSDADDFSSALRRRHAAILRGRPEKNPGEYKTAANRAGNTEFVAPELVQGTLEQGLALLHQLATPFQRAAFIMFMVLEIHPFADGNGRLARAMMNAELWSGGEARILIATAYRADYLGTLRRLSRDSSPRDYVRMLDRAQEFSVRLDFSDLEALAGTLRRCNAFDDTGLRVLRLPQ